MPHMPLDPVTWCDPRNYDARGQRLEGPCLYGLAWWIWLLLILGFCCCLVPVIWKVRASHKVGITPGRVVSFWEAVMLANHAYPNKSRLKGRPMKGVSPLDDLIQAQNCCCCLPLHKGLVLLSLIDLGRLGVQLALAIDSIAIYQQTEGPDAVPNADPRLAGLMDPELRRVMMELCIAVLIIAGTKVQPHASSPRSHPCEDRKPSRKPASPGGAVAHRVDHDAHGRPHQPAARADGVGMGRAAQHGVLHHGHLHAQP